MANQTTDKKGTESSAVKAAGLLGFAVATVAGMYFLYGTKQGKKGVKKVQGWALKVKGEVLEKLEGLKEVNEEKYAQIIDSVAKKYRAAKNIDQKEVEEVLKDLHSHWNNIKKELQKATKNVSKKISEQKKSKPAAKKTTKAAKPAK